MPASADIRVHITDQCALFARPSDDFRADILVAAGDKVAQGAPVLRSRRHPELTLVAPVAGEVAAADLGPGKRLSHVLFFHDAKAGRHEYDVSAARAENDPVAVRALLLSGSSLDGVEGRWLGPWRRQVAAIPGSGAERSPHWFSAALRRSSRPLPIIPTAALDHAFGGILPSTMLVRALAANDAEAAMQLGALSLVEEDVALADYVTAASPRLTAMLRAMLDRIAEEEIG